MKCRFFEDERHFLKTVKTSHFYLILEFSSHRLATAKFPFWKTFLIGLLKKFPVLENFPPAKV